MILFFQENVVPEQLKKEPAKKVRPKREIGGSKEGGGEAIGPWILSYSDMMTLLFAFLIILVSVSTTNQQKMEEISQAMAKSVQHVDKEKPLEKVTKEVEKIIEKENLKDKLSVELGAEGAKISFAGQALFEVGKAEINKDAESLLAQIADILKKDKEKHYVIVEGHTDNVPMKSEIFPSNWELSAARASVVIRYLTEDGLPSDRCKAVGYADTQPLVPNTTATGAPIPQNQSKNRRVVIKLSKNVKE